MKIGEKEFTAKISNIVIWNIEDDFDKSISNIMLDIMNLKMKEMARFIWFTIQDEITWDEFSKDLLMDQYVPAATEVGKALNKAFDTGKKKA